jgi:hypothetical protein
VAEKAAEKATEKAAFSVSATSASYASMAPSIEYNSIQFCLFFCFISAYFSGLDA